MKWTGLQAAVSLQSDGRSVTCVSLLNILVSTFMRQSSTHFLHLIPARSLSLDPDKGEMIFVKQIFTVIQPCNFNFSFIGSCDLSGTAIKLGFLTCLIVLYFSGKMWI